MQKRLLIFLVQQQKFNCIKEKNCENVGSCRAINSFEIILGDAKLAEIDDIR